jgi:hypothetical protein
LLAIGWKSVIVATKLRRMAEPENLVLALLREMRAEVAEMNARLSTLEVRIEAFEQRTEARLEAIERRLDVMHRNGGKALHGFIGHHAMSSAR